MQVGDLFRIIPTAIGFTPNSGGPGIRIIHGAGRLFITDVGFMIRDTAGCGCRIPCGDLRGLCGEAEVGIADGHPWVRG
jgi:hypothetical protein